MMANKEERDTLAKLLSERIPTEDSYPYDGDLHWLWMWQQRIELRLRKDRPATKNDYCLFTPNSLEKSAWLKYELKHPVATQLVKERLDRAKKESESLKDDVTESLELLDAMSYLSDDLESAIKAIDAAEKSDRTDKPKNAENNLPTDAEVLALCNYLKVNLKKSPSQIECAREFCRKNGHDPNDAENKMRSAFRYKNYWS